MRITLIIVSILISELACAGVTIKGEISNMTKNQYIYLYDYMVNQISVKDSAMVKGGKFTFKYKSLELGKYRLGFSGKAWADIILGSENVSVTADANDYQNSFTVNNSKENDIFKEFEAIESSFKKSSDKINLKARQIQYNAPNRNERMAQLQAEYDSLSGVRNTQLNGIVSKAPDSYSAVNAKYLLSLNEASQDDFYKDAGNTTLQRGDAFVKSFNPYLSRFLAGKNNNALKAALREIPKSKPENSRERETLYLALIKWSKKLDPKFSANTAREYAKEYKDSPYAKRVIKGLPKLPPGVGETAPDFTLKNPEGIEIPFSSTRGKVVLLDFWASWCGPCRRENPNVVKTYHKYKDKGFTVFSVSLDKGAAKWKAAIEKDGLVWENHVSDLKGWGSSAGRLYGVGSIPATFLIDQNGVVIAKNLRGHQLEKKLQEVFGE